MLEIVWNGEVAGVLVPGTQNLAFVTTGDVEVCGPPLPALTLPSLNLIRFVATGGWGRRTYVLQARKPKDRRFAWLPREYGRARFWLVGSDAASGRTFWTDKDHVIALDVATGAIDFLGSLPGNDRFAWEIRLVDQRRLLALSETATALGEWPWAGEAAYWPARHRYGLTVVAGAAGPHAAVVISARDGALERWDYEGSRAWRFEREALADHFGASAGRSTWLHQAGWRPTELCIDRWDRAWIWDLHHGVVVLDAAGVLLASVLLEELESGRNALGGDFVGVDGDGVAWWTTGARACGVRFPAVEELSPALGEVAEAPDLAPSLGEPRGIQVGRGEQGSSE